MVRWIMLHTILNTVGYGGEIFQYGFSAAGINLTLTVLLRYELLQVIQLSWNYLL